MNTTHLEVEQEGRLLRISLNRSEKRNSWNMVLCNELVMTLEQAQSDPTVGAVLLRANGPVFCAGMDLDEALDPVTTEKMIIHDRLFTIGARLEKPIIAAVQGPAIAVGTGLVAN